MSVLTVVGVNAIGEFRRLKIEMLIVAEKGLCPGGSVAKWCTDLEKIVFEDWYEVSGLVTVVSLKYSSVRVGACLVGAGHVHGL